MAYDKARLSSWHDNPYSRKASYTHGTDTKANMKAANYFNEAWASLPKGTRIECVAAMDTTPVFFDLVVTASAENAVTVAEQNYA